MLLNRKINKRKGFTLIEILVVTALVGVVITTSTQLFARILRANAKARAILEIKQQGDNALATITHKIRNADKIVEGTCTSTSIELADNTVEDNNTVYECSGDGRIKVTVGSADPTYLTSGDLETNCESLFICYTDPGGAPNIVEISFTLALEDDLDNDLTFSTTVSLRNY